MANRLAVPFTVLGFFDGVSDTLTFDVETDAVAVTALGGEFPPKYNPGKPSGVENLSTEATGLSVTLLSLSGSTVTLQFSAAPTAGFWQTFGALIY
jgi:hypothetical protein